MKCFDNLRIKLFTSPLIQFLRGGFVWPPMAIHTIAGDGVESVSNREDARADVDLGAFQAQRIS